MQLFFKKVLKGNTEIFCFFPSICLYLKEVVLYSVSGLGPAAAQYTFTSDQQGTAQGLRKDLSKHYLFKTGSENIELSLGKVYLLYHTALIFSCSI